MPIAPKDRKAKRQMYDYIESHGRQNEISSCKIRLTTANFEPWSHDPFSLFASLVQKYAETLTQTLLLWQSSLVFIEKR